MWALRDPIPAVVISPLVPEPPVTGGQKRTLRLLEAMERAGLHPRILTADTASEEAAQRLRNRGWTVDVVPEPEPGLIDRVRQHAQRRPSPLLHGVAFRFGELVKDAALVQYEHTQSAYYRPPAGVATVLSLHNVDSAAAGSAAETARDRLAEGGQPQPPSCARSSAATIPRADRVLAVSEEDAAIGAPAGGTRRARPQRRRRRVLLRRRPGDEDRALFFGHFGYEANRRGVARFLAEGWPEVRRRARTRASRSRAAGPTARAGVRTASTSSASCPTCRPSSRPPAR